MTTRKVTVARIVDQDKVYAFFRDEPEVRDLLHKLAQRCIDSKITCPGVETVEETVAR